MVIAGQSSWGKGAIAGDEARRGRKTTPEKLVSGLENQLFTIFTGQKWPKVNFPDLTPTFGGAACRR
jgi:hypothetical protein